MLIIPSVYSGHLHPVRAKIHQAESPGPGGTDREAYVFQPARPEPSITW